MSEVLARIRVRETHGIRRFLYPLMAVVELPEDTDTNGFCLMQSNGVAIPTELEAAWDFQVKGGFKKFQFGFAVSLGPHEGLELHLFNNSASGQLLDDPLNVQRTQDGGLESIQKRFYVLLAKNGDISRVVYDDVPHLKSSSQICLNGLAMPSDNRGSPGISPLYLYYVLDAQYRRAVEDGGEWQVFFAQLD